MSQTSGACLLYTERVMEFVEELIDFLAWLGIILLVFLLIREVVCWYAKINRRIDLLEEQNSILREMLDEMRGKSRGDTPHSEN